MGKVLKFEYEGVPYTLEFTRKTVEKMERRGFSISEVTTKPMTAIPQLFAGAFLAHHPTVKAQLVDEILENMGDKENLIAELSDLYSEPILSLIESEPGKKGKVAWTVE